MALGLLSICRGLKLAALTALAFGFLILRCSAEDSITKKDGTVIPGTITGVANGQITLSRTSAGGGVVKSSFYLTDIKSVNMTPPDEVAKAHSATPDQAIVILEPLVRQYAGLPADWVTDAMAELGGAYDNAGKAEQATAIYTQINQLYPNSSYQYLAAAGTAQQLLKQGKVPEALAILQPIVDKANGNLAPSPAEGRLYANAFLVYGQALESEKKLPEALEAYLTVKTMFYQNPTLVAQAEDRVSKLRSANPSLGVD